MTLSPREKEVLSLVSQGYGNKTIASRLGLSYYTIKAHRTAIRLKLGADRYRVAVYRNATMERA